MSAFAMCEIFEMSFDRENFLNSLPHLPGVYRMLNATQEAIYVGKAVDLKKRVTSYFRSASGLSPRIQLMIGQVASIEITVTRSESEALLLENNLIKTLTPRYNILFRDDKSYPYVMLSGHRFPRLGFYRGTPSKDHQFFGPFPNAGAVRESIGLLQKVFRIRTCEDSVFSNRSRPCLLYQINRCTAPCVKLISEEAYAEHVNHAKLMLRGKGNEVIRNITRHMENSAYRQDYEEAAIFRDQIRSLGKVQESQFVSSHKMMDSDIIVAIGDGEAICVNLTMVRNGLHLGDKSFFPQNAQGYDVHSALEAFLTQHYLSRSAPPRIIVNEPIVVAALENLLRERAGYDVQIITKPSRVHQVWLAMAIKNAQLGLSQNKRDGINQRQMMQALLKVLGLDESVQRIECFDVSHTMGEATVVSCVVYDKLGLQKSEYRRYNISGITPGDDYAALENALMRRYAKLAKGEGKTPELILIDGGKGQIKVAARVLSEFGLGDIALIGVSKGRERKPGEEKLVFADQRKSIHLPSDHIALHLIQKIRDEAHRFAIMGHRAKRAKTRTTSFLEKIHGIGARRRQKLLAQFGGLKGIRSASVDDLCRVDGISRLLAEKIYQECH